jgi:azurin
VRPVPRQATTKHTNHLVEEESLIMRSVTVLSLFLAAVSVSPRPVYTADAPRTVDIVGSDEMKYSVTTITAKPGEQLRVRLVVKGVIPKVAMAHNFVLLKPGTNVEKFLAEGAPHRAADFIPPTMVGSVIAKTALAGPGEMVQVTFAAPTKPGRYIYLCTFAGHYQAGMKGVLIVK